MPSPRNSQRRRWIRLRQKYTKDRSTSSARFFGNEYDLLCKDPRVTSFDVNLLGYVIVETSKVFWESKIGKCHYLGMFKIILDCRYLRSGNLWDGLQIICTDSGRHDGKRYRLNCNGETAFCFGSRATYLHQLKQQGELFSLIQVILESLWHVNEVDSYVASTEYRTVYPDGTIGPCDPSILVSLYLGGD